MSLLRELYEGESRGAIRFRYSLMAFDLLTIIFLVVTSFVKGSPFLVLANAVIGLMVLAEFIARLSISRRPLHDVLHPLGFADVAVIISFLAPIGGQGLGFLRALRVLAVVPLVPHREPDAARLPFVRATTIRLLRAQISLSSSSG